MTLLRRALCLLGWHSWVYVPTETLNYDLMFWAGDLLQQIGWSHPYFKCSCWVCGKAKTT